MKNIPKIAICQRITDMENSYLAFMDLRQTTDTIVLHGMLRTMTGLPSYESFQSQISLNYAPYESISLQESVSHALNADMDQVYSHPCYSFTGSFPATSSDIAGKDMLFFVDKEGSTSKILAHSECLVGERNPFFRVYEQSFCLENIDIIDKD